MIIGIDASQAVSAQKTGVQWYAYHLLRALKSIVPPAHHLRLYSPTHAPAALKSLPPHWEERVLSWPFRRGWTLCRLSAELRNYPPEVFFSPGHIIPPFIPCKSVVTIHDLGFREFPHSYRHPQLMNILHAWNAKKACAIITPSLATKEAIIDAYGINPEKIHVIPHGYDTGIYHPYDHAIVQQALNRYNIRKPYVIAVGRLEEKKNTLQVLKLVQSIHQQRHPELVEGSLSASSRQALHFGRDDVRGVALVLIGSRGYGYEKIKKWIFENRAGDWVHELGWLPSEEVAKLVCGASAYITLSRAEGFGLTVLEALACGAPVFASDIPPHREIGKDLAIYANPDNLIESANKLVNIINHDVRHVLNTSAQLSANSVEGSLSTFTWSHSALQTLHLLISTAG